MSDETTPLTDDADSSLVRPYVASLGESNPTWQGSGFTDPDTLTEVQPAAAALIDRSPGHRLVRPQISERTRWALIAVAAVVMAGSIGGYMSWTGGRDEARAFPTPVTPPDFSAGSGTPLPGASTPAGVFTAPAPGTSTATAPSTSTTTALGGLTTTAPGGTRTTAGGDAAPPQTQPPPRHASPPPTSDTGEGAPQPPTPTNLAAGRTVTDTGHQDGFAPSNAVDGDATTYWESSDDAYPQSITVELGHPMNVSRIVVTLPRKWDARNQTISVSVGTSRNRFVTIVGSTGYTFDPLSGNTSTITFPAQRCRYVRLTFTANTDWAAGQVSEIGIYPP